MLPVGVAGGSFEADRVAALKPELSCFRNHDALAVRHVDAGPDVESNGCLEYLRIPLALECLEATNSCRSGNRQPRLRPGCRRGSANFVCGPTSEYSGGQL